MTGFAKFMAFMNVVAALAFLYLATLDYNARRPWAYEVFRSELAIDGLPIDKDDPGPRRVDLALFHDLDDDTLKDMFAKAGGNPAKGSDNVVRTQLDEVERVQKKTIEELEKLKGDDGRFRSRLREVVLPLAYSLEERDFWAHHIDAETAIPPQKLIEEFNQEFFERAKLEEVPPSKSDWLAANQKTGDKLDYHGPLTRRHMIAHLLYNLTSTPQDHYRVMVVIGLRAYVGEADGQASRLRDMGQRIRLAMLDERRFFEAEYTFLVQRVLTVVEELYRRQQFLKSQQNIKDRNEDLKKIREKDKEELEANLVQANKAVDAALKLQGTLEQQLFETQRVLGDIKQKTEEMERYINGLEVRVRR